MIAKTSITLVVLLFLGLKPNLYGQREKNEAFKSWEKVDYQKERIYLLYEADKKCDWQKKFYSKKETGIIFNLGCKSFGTLLFPDKNVSDTINISTVKKMKTISMVEVSYKIKEFRQKMFQKLPLKEDEKLYQAYDNNDIFNTFLLERLNKDKYVVYPVIWRNQDIIE